MLHKKKRWTAAMHGTGQPSAPVLLPASVSPTKAQWSGHPPSVSPTPRHSTPPVSTPPNKFPPTNAFPVDIFSTVALASQVAPSGSTQTARNPTPNDTVVSVCAPVSRSDISPNLLSAITRSPELFQQPGLLLHILPQEYIEKYTRSLEKRASTSNLSCDPVTTIGQPVATGLKSTECSFTHTNSACLNRGSQPSQRSGLASDHQSMFRTTSPTSYNYQPTAPRVNMAEFSKIVKSPLPVRPAINPQAPLFSCASITNSCANTQRFSPSRHSSGPTDSHLVNKGWSPVSEQTLPQQSHLSALDHSTISAVARAAGLFHSSPQMNAAAAAALLSQWDPASQMALLSQNRDLVPRPESAGHRQSMHSTTYPLSLSVTSSLSLPAGLHSESSSSHSPMGRVTSRTDVLKRRISADMSTPSTKAHLSNCSTSLADSRRPTPKSTSIPSRPSDSRPLLTNATIPATVDALKSFRMTPPWSSTDSRSEQTTYTHLGAADRGFDSADTRLSILHDAKMAALSVDWPSTVSSVNVACGKSKRAQSSGSFSSPMSSSPELNTMLQVSSTVSKQQQQPQCSQQLFNNRYPLILKDHSQASPSASGVELLQAPIPVRARQGIPCSSPSMVVPVSIKSPTTYPSICLAAPPPGRYSTVSPYITTPTAPGIPAGKHGIPYMVPVSLQSNGEKPLKSVVSVSASGATLNRVPPPVCGGSKSPSHPELSTVWMPSKLGSQNEPQCTHTVAPIMSAPSSNSNARPSNDDQKSRHSESRSLMPLKKRLIQRYEADSSGGNPDPQANPEQMIITAPKLSAHSPGGQVDSVLPSGSDTPGLQYSSKQQQQTADHRQKVLKIEPFERPSKNKKTNKFIETNEECKLSARRIHTNITPKRSTSFRGSRRVTRLPDARKLQSPKNSLVKSTQDSVDNGQTRKQAGRRARHVSSDTRSPISSNETNEPPRRRMAAVNGTILMMVASREQRSNSSASSRSCSSVSRSEAAGEESDNEQNGDSDVTTDVTKVSETYQRHKSNPSEFITFHQDLTPHDGGSFSNTQSINERIRKPKRAAALAASAATAASASVAVKRPRLAHSDAIKRRIVAEPDEDATGAEDDSVSTDDASSVVTTDSKSTTATNTNPMLDELSAALLEDKLPLDELIQKLSGTPDLKQLTNRSLHPAHSLEYYKRSRTAFVQLVSCNDPVLKHIPKCRACRQTVKRSHLDSASIGSVNGGGESGVSDEEFRDKTNSKPHSGGAIEATDGQFKRPNNGRNTTTDREKHKDTDSDRIKSERPRSKKNAISHPVSVFCRFWGFRKLVFNNRGILKIAGFCHSTEASPEDRSLWEMHYPVSPQLNSANAKYILERAGLLFCRLLRQELAVLMDHRDREPVLSRGPGAPPKNGLKRSGATVVSSSAVAASCASSTHAVAWKRPVKGVREMCDVCETTMFNTHWVCAKCGYSVCVHCYEEARFKKRDCLSKASEQENQNMIVNKVVPIVRDKNKGKQPRVRAGPPGWASCTTTRQHHDPERLLLTALLPACTVGKLLHRVHRIARHYQIRLGCGCMPNITLDHNELLSSMEKPQTSGPAVVTGSESSLDLLADLALKVDANVILPAQTSERVSIAGDDTESKPLTQEPNEVKPVNPVHHTPLHTWVRKSDTSPTKPTDVMDFSPLDHKESADQGLHAVSKYRVLQLHDPDAPHMMEAFQNEWLKNRPIVISGCSGKFDRALWSPRSFAEEFGPLRTTLVDCATGLELTRYPLRTFWDGFERKSKRLVSKDGRALCLKLKDWPTTDDFAELQPHRFANLMSNLPMPEYTCREGQRNMAARLTSFFVCPDLGPKLYVAYGTGGSRSMGTTNLHVDIADAINIMLYVGHPSDSIEESSANAEAVLNVMRQAHLDSVYMERAMRWMRHMQFTTNTTPTSQSPTDDSDIGPPGALWHIFLPEDMPTLRAFLTQITEEETGASVEPGSDPIHDQLFYLDQPLLDRLYAYAGVLPCTIIQFCGDAVFVPAGAAHQVRNLNSCIKAAVDFVSPEHLPQCFQLIEEFRRLSTNHQNHEDKLQVKNMLFHAVKDALSVLLLSNDTITSTSEQRDLKPDENTALFNIAQLFDPSRNMNDSEFFMNASLLNKEEMKKIDHANHFRSEHLTRSTMDHPIRGCLEHSSDLSTNRKSDRKKISKSMSNRGRTKGRPGRPKSLSTALLNSQDSPSYNEPKGSPDSDSSHSSSQADHVAVQASGSIVEELRTSRPHSSPYHTTQTAVRCIDHCDQAIDQCSAQTDLPV
ncbi:Jumonji domain-containing protein 1 [Paragonimus heterotremus]|uniref:Jumonji domain-containing protein 1 n=1 Tax=Paragonimus heterotremus TaxID=100268 RepID=A0A8J4TPR3_9TREM|nr:Jumonji domain-containing protein 1 [Paragonimus heterotremus]